MVTHYMTTQQMTRATIFVFLSLILLILTPLDSEAALKVGEFSFTKGRVDILRDGALPAIPAAQGVILFNHDVIRTKTGGSAKIEFLDGNSLLIAQRSRIDISNYRPDGVRAIHLQRGMVQAIVNKERAQSIAVSKGAKRLEIQTANAVAGVRGTNFFVFFNENITGVLVREGIVYTYNINSPTREVILRAGTITLISNKEIPLAPRSASRTERRIIEIDMYDSMPESRMDAITYGDIIAGGNDPLEFIDDDDLPEIIEEIENEGESIGGDATDPDITPPITETRTTTTPVTIDITLPE